MQNTLKNISLNEKIKDQVSLEIRNDNENINILVNQKNGTFELTKEIRKIFKSIVPTSKCIVLDLSKMEDIGGSFRLIIINMLLSCRNNGVNLKIIHGRENI